MIAKAKALLNTVRLLITFPYRVITYRRYIQSILRWAPYLLVDWTVNDEASN